MGILPLQKKNGHSNLKKLVSQKTQVSFVKARHN